EAGQDAAAQSSLYGVWFQQNQRLLQCHEWILSDEAKKIEQTARSTNASVRHHVEERAEQIMAVMRTGRGFRMILNAECPEFAVLQPLNRLIVEVHMRDLGPGRERLAVHGKSMVLRGDLDLAVLQIQHGLIGAPVAELQLERLPPQRQPQQLMPQADPEDGSLSENS